MKEPSQGPSYWLMKSEPSVFGFNDLLASPGQTAGWDGVRNYQARNFLRQMREGDLVFVYHSSTAIPGIAGLAQVSKRATPDPTQFDPAHAGYDPKATPEKPRWSMVEIQAIRPFRRLLSLAELKADPALSGLLLVQRGSRLSVMPVPLQEAERLLSKEVSPPDLPSLPI